MPNPVIESLSPPFMNFRFEVLLTIDKPFNGMSSPVCSGAFSGCSGLDMTMDAHSFNEGGANQQQTHLKGKVTYSQLTLRRGMTPNQHLRIWFDAAGTPGINARANGTIIMLNPDGGNAATFKLLNCLPVSYNGPAFSASNGEIAVEQLQLAYARLIVQDGGGARAGGSVTFSGGFSVGANASANVSVSGGAGLSFDANASANASFGFG